MRVLDLFSGIGGFSLGLERAGMRTVAFCEIEPYCRAVLAKHWPDVPCYTDVRELTAAQLAADGIAVDLICGGFPCQDISVAGKGAGLAGARSGLWSHYARLIGELRPKYVIVENVAALLSRGLAEVLGELATLGYDAEWHCIPASHVGAPHRRDRIWIIAYPQCDELWNEPGRRCRPSGASASVAANNGTQESLANTGCAYGNGGSHEQSRANWETCQRDQAADHIERCSQMVGDADSQRQLQPSGTIREEWRRPSNPGWWSSEPDVGRVAHGVPARVDRLKSLGNAVVPQIPELVGRAIMSANTSFEKQP